MATVLSPALETFRPARPRAASWMGRWRLPGWPVGWLLAAGIALRAWHYLRDPSIWIDEAALVVNVLGKGFKELLGPLLFSEAAPPLFLWIERGMVVVFGDGLYALRLVPFAASCAALVLVWLLARRVLREEAVPWAVLLFAVSDRLLWHCCEAKPYALDVLAAAGLAYLYVAMRGAALVRQMIVYAGLAPLLIFLGYSSGFLYGGLLVALLPVVWKSRRAGAWLSYALLALTVFVSFGLLVAGPVRAQRDATIPSCWEDMGKFPPWDRPWMVPWWLVCSTLNVASYCCRPAGEALMPLAVVGAASLWRRSERGLLSVLLLPVLLALGASLFRAYPYGGTRVLAYAAPALFLLAAEGVPPSLAWLRARRRLAALLLAIVLLTPMARTAWRTVTPWRRADTAGAAAYVLQHRRPTDAVTGNYWDYTYLFREIGPAFTPLDPWREPAAGRLWAVISSRSEEELRGLLRSLRIDQWQVLEHREFVWTDVYLLQRPPPP